MHIKPNFMNFVLARGTWHTAYPIYVVKWYMFCHKLVILQNKKGISYFNIFKFLYFWKYNVFYAEVAVSQKILWNYNYSIKIAILKTKELHMVTVIFYYTNSHIFGKNNGFWAAVAISRNFLSKKLQHKIQKKKKNRNFYKYRGI